MISNKSPEFACGQIVYNVKMSQLNYTIQETPYSLYMTVRKKFKKDANLDTENQAEALGRIEKNNSDIIENQKSEIIEGMEKEIMDMKERTKDNLVDIGRLEFDNEELELSN